MIVRPLCATRVHDIVCHYFSESAMIQINPSQLHSLADRLPIVHGQNYSASALEAHTRVGASAMYAVTYGQCAECGCPAFAGQGTYCDRDGCRHHWKSHRAE